MKKSKVSFKKMNKDISPDKFPQDFYFEAYEMRIVTNDSQTSVSATNEKGNEFLLQLPNIQNITNFEGGEFRTVDPNTNQVLDTYPYTNTELTNIPYLSDLKIIYITDVREKLIIFTTDSVNTDYGQIWELTIDEDYNPTLTLLYNNALEFSLENPIRKAIGRFENEEVQKVYFTDYNNYLRFVNIADEDLINTRLDQIDIFPTVSYSKPTLTTAISGGNFTAGMVQYAYSLYDKNGAETKLSPYSDLYNINDIDKGNELDDSVSISLELEIDNIDEDFNNIRIYRIFYNDLESEPEVSLIIEEEIGSSIYQFIDDGSINIAAMSIEEITFLGSDPFISKDLETKDNHLFPANIKYDRFDVDIDTRCFRFNSSSDTLLQDNTESDISFNFSNIDTQEIPEEFDCINPSIKAETTFDPRNPGTPPNPLYNEYIYQGNGTTLGAEGKNIRMEIKQDSLIPDSNRNTVELIHSNDSYLNPVNADKQSLKRDENYRWFIRFINDKGQRSFVKWLCDLRMPNQDTHPITTDSGNEIITHPLYVNIELKDTSSLPSNVVAYEVLRENRDKDNRTITAQGIVNCMVSAPGEGGSGSPVVEYKPQPSWNFRTWKNIDFGQSGYLSTFIDDLDLNFEVLSDFEGHYRMNTFLLQMYSPDVEFDPNFRTSPTDYVTVVGGIENYWNQTWRYRNDSDDQISAVFSSAPESSTTDAQRGLWVRAGDGKNFGAYNTGSIILDEDAIGNDSDENNYRSIVRKGGALSSDNIAKLNIFGEALYTPSSTGLNTNSFDSGFGSTEFVNNVFVARMESNDLHKLRSINGTCLTFQIGFTGDGIGSVLDGTVPRENNGKFIVCDYKRPLTNQYGGDTYEVRSRATPVVVSDHIPINQITSSVYNGDTFISFYNMLRTRTFSPNDFIRTTSWKETIIVPVETYQNVDLRQDTENNRRGRLKEVTTTFEDYYKLNPVYNKQKSNGTGIPKPFNFTEVELHDNRVLASDVKINGELTDSWTKYRPNNFMDVNGDYGPITGIYEDRDQLFVFQPEAVCMLSINPRVQVQGSDGVAIQLGTGELLQDYNYLTTSSGSINQFGIIKSPVGLFYPDILNYKLSLLAGGEKPISDIEGLHSYLKNNTDIENLRVDNPLLRQGISGYYDKEFNEVYFTFLQDDNEFTVSYSNMLQGWHNYRAFKSELYHNNRNRIVSTNTDLNKLYTHKIGKYGVYYDNDPETSYITFIFNPDADIDKIFDTLLYNSKVILNNQDIPLETLSNLQAYNDYQDSSDIELVVDSNVKRKFREWRIQLPREEDTRNRLRSQYLYVKLEFENNNDKEFVLQDIILSYRLFPATFI